MAVGSGSKRATAETGLLIIGPVSPWQYNPGEAAFQRRPWPGGLSLMTPILAGCSEEKT